MAVQSTREVWTVGSGSNAASDYIKLSVDEASISWVDYNRISATIVMWAEEYAGTTHAFFAKPKGCTVSLIYNGGIAYTPAEYQTKYDHTSSGHNYPGYSDTYGIKLKSGNRGYGNANDPVDNKVEVRDVILTLSDPTSTTTDISVEFNRKYGNTVYTAKTLSVTVALPSLPSVEVTYHKNDGTGATVTQSFTINGDATTTVNGNIVKKNKFGYSTDGSAYFGGFDGAFGRWNHQKSGYTLLGWGGMANGTTAYYSTYSDVNDSWIISSSPTIALYAIWSKTITISYNANGGSGAPANQSAIIYNSTLSHTFTLSTTKPKREGYTFLGWSTSSTATNASNQPNTNYTASDDKTLYAVWRPNVLTIHYHINGGSVTSDTYSANSDGLICKSGSIYEDKWEYDIANSGNGSYGLFNATTFGLTCSYHHCISWTNGTTNFGHDDKTLVPADFTTKINSGDYTITLYAVWQPNELTVNFYSGGADSFTGTGTLKNPLSPDENVHIYSASYKYDTYYDYGLENYKDSGVLTMSKSGYTATGVWGALNGLSCAESSAGTGQSIADIFGLSLENSNVSIDVYAQWKKTQCFMIKDNNTYRKGIPYIKVNGIFKAGKATYIKVAGQWIEVQ